VVLVLDQGRIIERGKHEELLANKGFYYNLYMSQFRGEAELPQSRGVAGSDGWKAGEAAAA
jgi:ATP-binding cassette subfamily B protein